MSFFLLLLSYVKDLPRLRCWLLKSLLGLFGLRVPPLIFDLPYRFNLIDKFLNMFSLWIRFEIKTDVIILRFQNSLLILLHLIQFWLRKDNLAVLQHAFILLIKLLVSRHLIFSLGNLGDSFASQHYFFISRLEGHLSVTTYIDRILTFNIWSLVLYWFLRDWYITLEGHLQIALVIQLLLNFR